MDLRSIKEILYLKYIKDLSNDFQSNLRINFELFFNKNKECSINSFDYILYCIFFLKLKKNFCLNKNIIILNQDYLNNSETMILNDNELFLNKIFIIPIINHSEDKWSLILLKNLFQKEENKIDIKIISSNKFLENIEIIVKDIIHKLSKIIIKEDLVNKIEKFELNNNYNSSKIILNLINDIIEEKKLEEFFIKTINEKNKAELFKELNSKNKIFEEIEKDYLHLIRDYIKYIKLIRNEIINSNNENSEELLLDDESPPKNANIIKNKEENYITEINKEKENNNKNEKEKIFDDKFEELAKKMTNEIMNLNCFRVKENNENY